MYCTGFGDTWFQAFGQDDLDSEQSGSEDDPSAKDTKHARQTENALTALKKASEGMLSVTKKCNLFYATIFRLISY